MGPVRSISTDERQARLAVRVPPCSRGPAPTLWEGQLARDRARCGWTSSRHRWRPLQGWLARFGPARLSDITWGTGWTLTAPRAAVAATMSWQERHRYRGDHEPHVFDTNGSTGPTVWMDGRIVGGWAQRKTGRVVVRLLEDLGSERAAKVDGAATRLQGQPGDLRVAPRFPTPTNKALSR